MASLKSNIIKKNNLAGVVTRVTANERKGAVMHHNDWPNEAGFNALEETRTPVELQVSGRFPDYVAGSLYRTGPGGYKVPRHDATKGDFACSHWFDGFVLTHKFQLVPSGDEAGMRITYSSRCQVDELVEKARESGRLEGITFGQKRDPCDTIYRKMKTVFEPTLNLKPRSVSIGVVLRNTLPTEAARLKDPSQPTVTVTTDSSLTKQFDPDTLAPHGVTQQADLHPALKGPLSAAHASRDPATGDLYNYNLEFGPVVTYRVFRVSAQTGKVDILARVTGAQGHYVHSLLLTENFVVLCLWPAVFRKLGISILLTRNIVDALDFDAHAAATWLVIDRRHGRGVVKRFTSPAFFCFHTTNAWEESPSADADADNVDITCELVQFPNMDILQKFYYANMVSSAPGVGAWDAAHTAGGALESALARYKLRGVPLHRHRRQISPSALLTTSPAERILHLRAGDLPVINPRFALRPHRYVWSVLARGRSSFVDGLGKHDALSGETVVWERERHTPGEPVFVPDPAGSEEDGGVLLCVVLDGDAGTSYLLCLDARTMREVARADVPTAIGFGFHGLHVPQT